MNGVKYYRMKMGLSLKQLSVLSGVNMATITEMEKGGGKYSGIYSANYLKIRGVLAVTVDELLRDDLPDVEAGSRVRVMRQSRTGNVHSCLNWYRFSHMLTLDDMAARIGVSREYARVLCAAEVPSEKYIQVLANHEGISPTEFIKRYSPPEEAAS